MSFVLVLCGIPAEAKFDIFNDQKERVLYAFESKQNSRKYLKNNLTF